MKSTFVRVFVMTLAFAGFSASSYISKAPAKTISTASSFVSSGMPVPMCAPSDPSHCGMH